MSDETARAYDELLVALTLSGDRRAGERLAARWRPRLLRTARRLLGDADAAEDAVQEAWAGIARGLVLLHDPAKFPAWAFQHLRRRCADALRRTVRERGRASDTDPDLAGARPARVETLTSLDQAFQALPPDQRVAAVLFFGEGLALAEIAAATGAPVGTVKSRLFHARRRLKAALGGDVS